MRSGLEGVVVAETVLSHAEPERGMLWVRGRPIAELVAQHGYEGPSPCSGRALLAMI